MSWLSDRWRDVRRGASSDVGKAAIGLGLGAYMMNPSVLSKFLSSSLLKNMAKRYATSYGTNLLMGRPHAGKGAAKAAAWSVVPQIWKNYQLAQPLLGGESGMDVLRPGTDTPWWKLMLGQGREGFPLEPGFQGPTGTDPELGFMDMFTKDVPIRGESGAGEGILAGLGLGRKGPITGYKKGLDLLGFAPEVMGYAQSGFEPEEIWEQGKGKTRKEKAFMDEMMLNPYYRSQMYGWPGWGLPTAEANRGGIMQKLQGGGDFLEGLMASEEAPMAEEVLPEGDIQAYSDFPEATEEMFAGNEGIPPEILEGIVNQREPLMEMIMEMIMRMIAPTLGEDEEMPMMGPGAMGEMGDYLGPQSEMGVEEQGDLGLGMQSGGDYTRGSHVVGPGGPTSDDVNAKLSDGEFVMTANAVKNAGGGDRMEGAKRMYSMMNRLDPSSARPGEEPQIV